MPEIWLNYGVTEVVVDIRAENLGLRVDGGSDGSNGGSSGSTGDDAGQQNPAAMMDDGRLGELLEGGIDLTGGPTELVVLQSTPATHRVVSALYEACKRRSAPMPRILAGRGAVAQVKRGLPEGAGVSEFGDANLTGSNLVFLGEAEPDGLFGFETVSTRLLRRFGQPEDMLAAYAKRRGNLPSPGVPAGGLEEARRFVDSFEIAAIDVVATPGGIVDVAVGHPSKTMAVTSGIERVAARDAGEPRPKAVLASTGKEAGNRTLAAALSSLWNCYGGIREGGLVVLLAECGDGLGSDALGKFVEGRMPGVDRLKNPSAYVDGMEGLLYLSEVKKALQVGLVSILPEFYTKRLGVIPLDGARHAMEYVLRTQGPRQKISVVSDGARTLLR